MAGLEPRRGPARVGTGTLALLTLAGALAAAWAWNRKDEEALRRVTEARLRPFARKNEP